MGFSRQEYWGGLPCPPPGDLPNPGIEPSSISSSALIGRFFTTSTTWEALLDPCLTYSLLSPTRVTPCAALSPPQCSSNQQVYISASGLLHSLFPLTQNSLPKPLKYFFSHNFKVTAELLPYILSLPWLSCISCIFYPQFYIPSNLIYFSLCPYHRLIYSLSCLFVSIPPLKNELCDDRNVNSLVH